MSEVKSTSSIRLWSRESRNTVVILWVGILLALVGGWAAIPWLVDREERVVLESARRNGKNLAHVFAEQATRTIEAVDQMLLEIAANTSGDPADTLATLKATVARFTTIRDLLVQVSTVDVT